jgi:hypothetical protein
MPRYFVLSLDAPFRQKDGFFVREDGAVCYWPRFWRVGFVIPAELTQKTGDVVTTIHNNHLKSLLAFAVYTFIVIYGFKYSIIPEDFWLLICLIPVGFVAIELIRWRRITKWMQFIQTLKEFEKIRHPRPPAIEPILEARDRSKWFVFLFMWPFCVFLSVWVGGTALFGVEDWIDRLVLLAACGGLWWVPIRTTMLRRSHFDLEDHIPPGVEWQDASGKILRNRSYPVTGEDEA